MAAHHFGQQQSTHAGAEEVLPLLRILPFVPVRDDAALVIRPKACPCFTRTSTTGPVRRGGALPARALADAGGRDRSAALPTGIVGGFGPEDAALHPGGARLGAGGGGTACRIGEWDRLEIPSASCRGLLAGPLWTATCCELGWRLQAGSRSTIPRPGTRGADGVTTQIGNSWFAVFRTATPKSREAFLSLLRAGHTDQGIDMAALAYMRARALAGSVIAMLAAHRQDVRRYRGEGTCGVPSASVGCSGTR